jgi:hypothetical protein
MSDQNLRVVHGVRMLIPGQWEDTSIYRFNAPVVESEGSALQPNVLISRHEKKHGDSPDRFLELTNVDAKQKNPTFAVGRAGTVMYFDQVAAWQDTTFTDPKTSAPVMQRQVVMQSWPRHLTLITITGAPAGVERLSAEIGLGHLGETPGGTRVSSGGNVVAGTLVSK